MSWEIWTEKYRPKSLDEMVNQKEIVERLGSFVRARNVPHCIFAGPPGTGKTTAALCLAHDLYGDGYREHLMELNASDERGINVVRNTLKTFARIRSIGELPFKIMILDVADVDPDMLFEWIYENVPYHFTDPRDLARAMDALAEADVYRGRIRSTRDWKLLRYVVDFMMAGVAMAREKARPTSWVPLRFPERIRMLSRTKRERQMRLLIGMKIKRKCHISAVRAVKEVLPYLRVIFENNTDMAAGISKRLDLDEMMIEYLAGDGRKARAVIKSYGR